MSLRTIACWVALSFAVAACGGDGDPAHDHGSRGPDDAHAHDDHAHDGHAADGNADHDSDHDSNDDIHGLASTRIPADVARAAGIAVAPVGGGVIRDEHDVQGLLTLAEGRHARVVARFPGPVTNVRVGVGDGVRAGQALATVESNISLSEYAVTAPIGGTVLRRDVSVGDLAGDAPLFEIADLTQLWVDIHLFGADAQHITAGLPVVITRLSDGVRAQTRLDRILPGTATASQSTVARATLANADGRWRPGAAVQVRVTVAETAVERLVPLSAVQRMDGRDIVFVQEDDRYEARPVQLGERDGSNVRILSGVDTGEPVVVEQSYLVKADIEKSGAAHDH